MSERLFVHTMITSYPVPEPWLRGIRHHVLMNNAIMESAYRASQRWFPGRRAGSVSYAERWAVRELFLALSNHHLVLGECGL